MLRKYFSLILALQLLCSCQPEFGIKATPKVKEGFVIIEGSISLINKFSDFVFSSAYASDTEGELIVLNLEDPSNPFEIYSEKIAGDRFRIKLDKKLLGNAAVKISYISYDELKQREVLFIPENDNSILQLNAMTTLHSKVALKNIEGTNLKELLGNFNIKNVEVLIASSEATVGDVILSLFAKDERNAEDLASMLNSFREAELNSDLSKMSSIREDLLRLASCQGVVSPKTQDILDEFTLNPKDFGDLASAQARFVDLKAVAYEKLEGRCLFDVPEFYEVHDLLLAKMLMHFDQPSEPKISERYLEMKLAINDAFTSFDLDAYRDFQEALDALASMSSGLAKDVDELENQDEIVWINHIKNSKEIMLHGLIHERFMNDEFGDDYLTLRLHTDEMYSQFDLSLYEDVDAALEALATVRIDFEGTRLTELGSSTIQKYADAHLGLKTVEIKEHYYGSSK